MTNIKDYFDAHDFPELYQKAHDFLEHKGVRSISATIPAIIINHWMVEFVKEQEKINYEKS